MTDLESIVNHINVVVLTAVMSGEVYSNYWDDTFRIKYIKEKIQELKDDESLKISAEMIENASLEQLSEIGFGAWDEPNEDNQVLMLVPITLYPFIDGELDVISFNGNKNKLKDVDTDHRMGLISSGVYKD